MIEPLALLVCATLFGGMILYSFGFAPFVFSTQEAAQAGRMLRAAFPRYYLFVLLCAAAAALLLVPLAPLRAAALGLVALSTIYTRQVLMVQINAARDAQLSGNEAARRRFGLLHGASVVLNIVQIVVAGWVIVGFL
ncbi:DUF4149 domain-containing protein [Meridianimarinicoccus roseus]|uniref:DUF4149 domain-containing protein n=1 Tax=Meridianimarinicoccus roseus TaxID=2072018 RepID=A0A2V2LJH9_9RHOB|nr:DUF4149 domain-containing protein [Meridianimarinicoccus roseus]PWR02509.1 DUF4149 domain-containing protein [Meridianimarinicoccus roseus]